MDIISIHRPRGNRASVHLFCHVAGEVWGCLQHTSRAAAAGGTGPRAEGLGFRVFGLGGLGFKVKALYLGGLGFRKIWKFPE